MAGKLASQATDAYDAAINGGRGISMCPLQSARRANLLIGVRSQGGKGRVMPRVSKKMCSALERPHRRMNLFDDNGGP